MEYVKTKNLIKTNPTTSIELPKNVVEKPKKILVINNKNTLNLEQMKLLINVNKNTPIIIENLATNFIINELIS